MARLIAAFDLPVALAPCFRQEGEIFRPPPPRARFSPNEARRRTARALPGLTQPPSLAEHHLDASRRSISPSRDDAGEPPAPVVCFYISAIDAAPGGPTATTLPQTTPALGVAVGTSRKWA